jgi:hypothetical protein
MAVEWLKLEALAHSTTPRSTLMITGAKWKTVEVNGWSHGMTKRRPGIVLLSTSEQGNAPSLSGTGMEYSGIRFESPPEERGSLNLEIQFDELVDVFGNDDILFVASSEGNGKRSIKIRSIPGSQPSLAKSFGLLPVGVGTRQ